MRKCDDGSANSNAESIWEQFIDGLFNRLSDKNIVDNETKVTHQQFYDKLRYIITGKHDSETSECIIVFAKAILSSPELLAVIIALITGIGYLAVFAISISFKILEWIRPIDTTNPVYSFMTSVFARENEGLSLILLAMVFGFSLVIIYTMVRDHILKKILFEKGLTVSELPNIPIKIMVLRQCGSFLLNMMPTFIIVSICDIKYLTFYGPFLLFSWVHFWSKKRVVKASEARSILQKLRKLHNFFASPLGLILGLLPLILTIWICRNKAYHWVSSLTLDDPFAALITYCIIINLVFQFVWFLFAITPILECIKQYYQKWISQIRNKNCNATAAANKAPSLFRSLRRAREAAKIDNAKRPDDELHDQSVEQHTFFKWFKKEIGRHVVYFAIWLLLVNAIVIFTLANLLVL